jgi:transposase
VTIGETTASCDDGETPKSKPPSTPIETVRELLAAGYVDEVLELFMTLLAKSSALQRQLDELKAKRFKSSEATDSSQLVLWLSELTRAQREQQQAEALAAADAELRKGADIDAALAAREQEKQEKQRKPRERPARRPFPEKLRRVPNPLDVPPEQRACPCCGKPRKCIGHEITETLELQPAVLVVRQDIREKLACEDCEGELCRAPLPERVVTGGRLGVKLVACMVVDKYYDGLALHRQLPRFRRLGASLPLSTLVDQVRHVAEAAKPLQLAAIEAVLASHVMQLDATGMPVLDKAHRDGTRWGNLWGYVGDGLVALYLYASTGKKLKQRDSELGPEDFLARRKGLVVADASGLFDASFSRDDLIECGCNMHGRRYFVKALDGGDSRAALVIGAYRKLYEIERRGRELSIDALTELRQRESKPVFDQILKWCQAYALYEPPSSPLGTAIRYFINNHEALGRFLEDGAIPIDNGRVERQHVRVALARKNFLFVGSDKGGERAAVIYTLLASCDLNGVDPVEYLVDVIPQLSRGVTPERARELLPHRWKAARVAATPLEADAHDPAGQHLALT